ncbi:sensor histidine kinase [Leyella stercorea]|uniref:sensor histidine kinase n=1 Tax=Leyella stercorea TaxID=363265 RepID=UPI002665B633|nr:HAMP domain-containing sensor histidine kinase [Leyella stercorea]
MTYDLYWVSVLGYIVITLIILIRERKYTHHNEKAGRVFMPLVCLSLAFYVVDFFWGMCLVDAIRSDAVYFVLSALLHVLAVVTTLSWLCYVLRYMNCPRRCRYVIQFVSAAQLLSEVVLVIANFFSPVMYRIVDGEYVRCKYALVTSFNVYSVFAVVLLGTLFAMMRKGICANGYTRYWAVLFSSLIPLLLGIMQVEYFASPFFSMGFMLSVLILYVFVVTATREKLYQSKTKFLQNMSHEIRTSLNMVYGFAQLLGMPEGSWTDEEREKYNTYINDNYRMLDLLLNDLIEYTQTNQKTFGVSCEPVDVAKICDSTLQSLQFAQSKSKQVQLQNELPDGFTIKSDARRIQQILMHMLFYGVQFASSDELLLSAKLNAGALELAVVAPNSSLSGMKELPVYVKDTLNDPDVDDLGVRIELCRRMACLLGGCIYIDTKSKDGVRIVLQIQNIL